MKLILLSDEGLNRTAKDHQGAVWTEFVSDTMDEGDPCHICQDPVTKGWMAIEDAVRIVCGKHVRVVEGSAQQMQNKTFRCPPDLSDRIDRVAEADGRTPSNWIRLALKDCVEAAEDAKGKTKSKP